MEAKNTDTQGYMITSTDEEPGKDYRNVRDLTAISWAAFCIDGIEEATHLKTQFEAKLALITAHKLDKSSNAVI